MAQSVLIREIMNTTDFYKFCKLVKMEGISSAISSGKERMRTRTITQFEQWWRYSRHYKAEIDPFRIIWINPHDINQMNESVIDKSERHLSHVIGGDWDKEKEPFENSVLYKSLEEHFKNGEDWENTDLYHRVIKGEYYWRGINSEEEFKNRTTYLENLYEAIKSDGFKTYSEIRGRKPRVPREIKVKIGRNGSFFYRNGKHRLIISKILDLNEIPVNVIVRHTEWQQLRDEVANANSISNVDYELKQFLDHPDIKYLI